MEIRHLENQQLHIAISDKGAELRSLFCKASGREWMWQGNPEFWPRTAPVLFPVVGKLNRNELRYREKTYSLTQHGFARDQPFQCIQSGSDELCFRLESNEGLRKSYPFNFALEINFKLENNRIHTDYRIENPGAEPLPFSIGAHPGFSLPGWPAKAYHLYFEKDKQITAIPLQDGLLDFSHTTNIAVENGRLELTRDRFQSDAIVSQKPQSDWIGIRSDGDSAELRVHVADFPWLGIWSKPGAPFVCIEPWHGHADPAGFEGDFTGKPGIILLQPGTDFTSQFTLEVRS